MKTAVSVVTYERPFYLRRCLEQIGRQSVAPSDVIVCDDTTPSCRDTLEAALGPLDDFLAPSALHYLEVPRQSIGAKRALALRLARDLGCDVLATWDDDDVYGTDRLELQTEPIISGRADATVASPEAWRWESETSTQVMTWGTSPFFLVDPRCEWGFEIVDEAIASLCYRTDLAAEYPDVSYDEDRVFLRKLKKKGARLERLPPGQPRYIHVKHAKAAAVGPLTQLYKNNFGLVASPPFFLAFFALTVYLTRLKYLVRRMGSKPATTKKKDPAM